MPVSEEIVQQVQARVGATIDGKWQLTRVLGIGGMAAVYAAVHRNQNRVAIKMLHDEQSRSTSMRSRFLREGYAANSVEHPGAVRVFDDGVSDGVAYLVMELLEGETLEDRLVRHGGRLPAAEVLALADHLLEVLAAAHDKGMVHRDIKPDNLFLTKSGDLKVLDFGIAHLKEIQSSGGTSTQVLMGTPSFMPPEQARARWSEVDARSDVWATGATLHYLLTGRYVHDGETFAEQLAHAVREPVKSLLETDPSVPRVVAEVVDRAVAFAPSERWQTARMMQTAVRRAQKLVGPPHTASVRTSDAKDDANRTETPTLLAADVSGARLPHSGALTPDTPGAMGAHSKPRWPLAFALVLAVGAVAVAVWWLEAEQRADGPEAQEKSVEPAPPSELAEKTPKPAEPLAVTPGSGERPVAAASSEPAASTKPVGAVTVTKRPVTGAERPAAAGGPSSPAAPRPVPSSTENLFDKRF
ncbi:MAG TPA: protein kinase [Polyangiaceae bacterium]